MARLPSISELKLYRKHGVRCERYTATPKNPNPKRPVTPEPKSAVQQRKDTCTCPIYFWGYLSQHFTEDELGRKKPTKLRGALADDRNGPVRTWNAARTLKKKYETEGRLPDAYRREPGEPEPEPVDHSKHTVQEAVDLYVAFRRGHTKKNKKKSAKNTIKSYTGLFYQRLLPWCADQKPPITALSKFSDFQVCEDFVDSLCIIKPSLKKTIGDALATNTEIQTIICFQTFLRYFVRHKWLDTSGAEEIEVPNPPTMKDDFGMDVPLQKYGMELDEYDFLIHTRLAERFAETRKGRETISRIMELRDAGSVNGWNIKRIADQLNAEGYTNRFGRKWNFVSVYKVIQTGTIEQTGVSIEQEAEALAAIELIRYCGLRPIDAYAFNSDNIFEDNKGRLTAKFSQRKLRHRINPSVDVVMPRLVKDRLNALEGRIKLIERPGQERHQRKYFFATDVNDLEVGFNGFMDRLYAIFAAARKQHPGRFSRIYTPYSLRHTFFIQYINYMLKHPDKISFFQISKMGGHSSETTTRDAYLQYIQSTNEIMADAGNGALDWMLAETENIRASRPSYGLKELTPPPKPTLLPGRPSGRLHKRSPEMKERMKTAWANNHTPEAIAKRTAKRRMIKPELAAEIRSRIENGESQKAVAAEIGVTTATMSNFINHKYGY